MQYSIFSTLPFAFVTKYCRIRWIKPDKWDLGREIRVRASTLAGFPLIHCLIYQQQEKKEKGVFLQMIPVKRDKVCSDLAYFNARIKIFHILLWELRFFKDNHPAAAHTNMKTVTFFSRFFHLQSAFWRKTNASLLMYIISYKYICGRVCQHELGPTTQAGFACN